MAVILQKTNPYTAPQTYHLKMEDFSELAERFILSGNIVDVEKQECYSGRLHISGGKIVRIERGPVAETHYILPGFIDAHVHIESSLLTPSAFAREAVKQGLVAAVADPHEIANVVGEEGVHYMLDDARNAGFKFFFGAPSCVPAAPADTSGATLDLFHVEQLLQRDDIYFLSEMMNYPGVLLGDPEVMGKIAAAKKTGKPVDGHAPGLSGDNLKKYVQAGISTDHECEDICEAEEKIGAGMKVIIREGSRAKNFDQLYPLINRYPSSVMICTDDCSPRDLLNGTLINIFKIGIDKGLNLFNLLRALSWNTVNHYNLPVGLLREGDFADCIIVDNLADLTVLQTYINGKKVFDKEEKFPEKINKPPLINLFNAKTIRKEQLEVKKKSGKIRVIGLMNKSLYTKLLILPARVLQSSETDDRLTSNVEKDILKVVVLNRYKEQALPSIGFVRGFGLKRGALCTSIAHDSHNIIAVGVDDDSLLQAMNEVIAHKGGVACYDGEQSRFLPLPIAGLMSPEPAEVVAQQYDALCRQALALGGSLDAPFMALSFLSLIVIPEIKIFDRGLFDVSRFQPVDLFV
ncbi:MAG: adenine deaminase [Prevotellaceae bacterium]|jgi:adenine deaminase|nr:adenine deaminase [Prevotellaceae bacterium]